MGLWDRQFEDLHALGIRFSDLEMRTLEEPEEGVLVMHLHPLWDPRTPEGQIWFMEDSDGNDVFRVETIALNSPYEVNEIGWGKNKRTAYLYEVMDHQYGVLDSTYPSYFGTVDYGEDEFDNNLEVMRRGDEPHPYAFWTCIPLGSAMEVEAAKRLIGASDRRLHNSLYEQLTFLCELEERSEYCISAEEIWREEMDPNFEPEVPGPYEAEVWAEYDDPEQMKDFAREAYQDLLDANVIYDPRIPLEEHRERGTKLDGYRFNPIEHYLESGDFLAEQLLRSVTSRMRFVKARMVQLKGKQELYVMQGMEGNL